MVFSSQLFLFYFLPVALALYYAVDAALRRALAWQPESNPADV